MVGMSTCTLRMMCPEEILAYVSIIDVQQSPQDPLVVDRQELQGLPQGLQWLLGPDTTVHTG